MLKIIKISLKNLKDKKLPTLTWNKTQVISILTEGNVFTSNPNYILRFGNRLSLILYSYF